MLLTIIAAVFVFGLLVLVHELGHFATAKMTNMRVDEFAIGFGPKIIGVRYGETLYSLRAIPLGGYNKIAGMDGADDEAGDRAYSAKPVTARMLVILAGSFMNFFLPVLLFFGINFFSGVHYPSAEPMIGGVIDHKPAERAGLLAGDRIVRIDGQPIDSWQSLVAVMQDGGGRVFKVEFERGGEPMATSLIPEYDEGEKRSMIGIVSSVTTLHPGFGESLQLAADKTLVTLRQMIDALGRIIVGGSTADLAGPLGVAQMAGEVAQTGMVPLLHFAAMLSINLGLVNLLPIPALDGGHFVSLLIEAVRGRPLSPKALQYAQLIGFVLLMSLMLVATMNDISR